MPKTLFFLLSMTLSCHDSVIMGCGWAVPGILTRGNRVNGEFRAHLASTTVAQAFQPAVSPVF
jgi:hypothetical protein